MFNDSHQHYNISLISFTNLYDDMKSFVLNVNSFFCVFIEGDGKYEKTVERIVLLVITWLLEKFENGHSESICI